MYGIADDAKIFASQYFNDVPYNLEEHTVTSSIAQGNAGMNIFINFTPWAMEEWRNIQLQCIMM